MGSLTDFGKGVLIGFCAGVLIACLMAGVLSRHKKDKELIEYVERQQIIGTLREDYLNRDPAEFLEEPGVRGAADGARAEFDRKRDEALQRFRSRQPD